MNWKLTFFAALMTLTIGAGLFAFYPSVKTVSASDICDNPLHVGQQCLATCMAQYNDESYCVSYCVFDYCWSMFGDDGLCEDPFHVKFIACGYGAQP